jgi:hypothetical protein
MKFFWANAATAGKAEGGPWIQAAGRVRGEGLRSSQTHAGTWSSNDTFILTSRSGLRQRREDDHKRCQSSAKTASLEIDDASTIEGHQPDPCPCDAAGAWCPD